MTEHTENGKVVDGKVVSTCHGCLTSLSRADGVFVGWCQECNVAIVRINPRTGAEEFLDGRSPWTKEDNLRLVTR